MKKDLRSSSEIFAPNHSWPQISKEFKILSIDELKTSESPSFLLGPLLPKPGLSVAFGPPKCGKTFLLLDAALRIAGGLSAHDGTEAQSGPVLWIAAEGSDSLNPRIEAWCQANGEPMPERFHAVEEPVNLYEGESFALQVALERVGIEPVAIFFDTLSRCSLGGDENHVRDMQRVVESAFLLVRRFGANVTLIHHSGKSARGLRGSSSLPASADQVFRVAKRGAGISVVSEAERNAAPFHDLKFQLVEAGSSMVVEYQGIERSVNKRSTKALIAAYLDGVQDEERWVTTKEVLRDTNAAKSRVSECLSALVDEGVCDVKLTGGPGNAKAYRLRRPRSTNEHRVSSITRPDRVVPPPYPLKGGEVEQLSARPATESADD